MSGRCEAIEFRQGLFRARKRIKQSNLLLISNCLNAVNEGIKAALVHRLLLDAYVDHHPEYVLTLNPVQVEESAPRIVRLAAESTAIAGVGPLAAIPGALADVIVEAMFASGSSTCLVENGGEISALSNRSLNVGIYSGNAPLSGKIGFHLMEDDFPIGIATSSGTVSHAVNFGVADSATVIADRCCLADACAKAVCNAVKGRDIEASVQSGLEVAESLEGVRCALVIRGVFAGIVGKLPKILSIQDDHPSTFLDILGCQKILL
jgi:ApbE superfamily uncharacterized protein (UPF0280 family)